MILGLPVTDAFPRLISLKRAFFLLMGMWFCALIAGCQPDQRAMPDPAASQTSSTSATSAKRGTILFFGDSLSAGYEMSPNQAWPALLKPRAASLGFHVVNASVSGETTAGGLARLPRLLETYRPSTLVLALGANDGLRGLPTGEMHANLTAMIKLAKANQVQTVLLIGIQLPPNFGPAFNQTFEQTFGQVAGELNVTLLPFLLQPIANDESQFNDDRLHPTAAAQPAIAEHVWAALQPLLIKTTVTP
jgi:acyl-CoA thioesterase I